MYGDHRVPTSLAGWIRIPVCFVDVVPSSHPRIHTPHSLLFLPSLTVVITPVSRVPWCTAITLVGLLNVHSVTVSLDSHRLDVNGVRVLRRRTVAIVPCIVIIITRIILTIKMKGRRKMPNDVAVEPIGKVTPTHRIIPTQ